MDVYGMALSDFFYKKQLSPLWLHNSYGDVEEMPIDIFFRGEDDMPLLEHLAIERCYGKILDIGAGAGSHSLFLQEIGHDVSAIDISSHAVSIMKARGITKVCQQDIFVETRQFDTLLMLMNGIGLSGSIPGLKNLLLHCKNLILPSGQLLFDSSDISYLYDAMPMPENQYFGEVSYCYEYKKKLGKWFNWLYIDQDTLKDVCKEVGFKCEIIHDDGEDQYLARLT